MGQLSHVRRALSAMAATGSVLVRQPTLLVYPVVLIALVAGLIAGIGAGIYLTSGNIVVWVILYASYFVASGVLLAFLFGALYYESDAVLENGAQLPLIGLVAVWRNRRRLLVVGLVVGTVGLAAWVGRPTLEAALGDEATVLLDVIVGTGSLTAIQLAVLGTGGLRENLDTIEAITEDIWVESLITQQVGRGIATVCLCIGAIFGIVAVGIGCRIEPFGYWTPFLGFLLAPALTILICMTTHGVSQAALFRYAIGDTERTAVAPSELAVVEQDESTG